MHVNMETPMIYIVSSERTSGLPACFSIFLFYIATIFMVNKVLCVIRRGLENKGDKGDKGKTWIDNSKNRGDNIAANIGEIRGIAT